MRLDRTRKEVKKRSERGNGRGTKRTIARRAESAAQPLCAILTRQRQHLTLFSPGLLVVLFGFIVLAFPRAVLTAVALLCISLGALLCYFIWKFQRLKSRIDAVFADLNGKVVSGHAIIRDAGVDIGTTQGGGRQGSGGKNRSMHETVIVEENVKKIILH